MKEGALVLLAHAQKHALGTLCPPTSTPLFLKQEVIPTCPHSLSLVFDPRAKRLPSPHLVNSFIGY